MNKRKPIRFWILFLISGSLLAAHELPVVVVAISEETVTRGLKEAIELGWADGGADVPIEKFISVDGTAEGMSAVAQEMVDRYPNRPLILFAGWYERELQAASQVFGPPAEGKPYRFAISSGSTERTLPPYCASSAPSLVSSSMGAHLYAQAMNCSGVVIAYQNSPYALDFIDAFKSQALAQRTQIVGSFEVPITSDKSALLQAMQPVFKALKNSISAALLLWVHEAAPLEEIASEIQKLPAGTRVLCTSLTDGLHDRFGNVPVAVMLPSIVDNTATTANVTSRLYAKKDLLERGLAWCVWNGYDGARAISALVRIGRAVTLESLAIKVDASIPAAALGPGWFDPKTGRSPYGSFWIINAHDEMVKTSDLPDFRKRVNGAVFSLPDSAGCVARLGHVPWLGIFPWYVEVFRWQKLMHSGSVDMIKHSAENLSQGTNYLFSRCEMAIPLYLKGNQVRGYLRSELPVCNRIQALEFPYPMPSYILPY